MSLGTRTAHFLLIELVMAIYEESKLLLQGSDPIKLLETKDRQEVTCVQNSFFSCIMCLQGMQLLI
jgi:hypothetical protein